MIDLGWNRLDFVIDKRYRGFTVMDKEQAVRIAKDYDRQVRSFINPADIILYGSYVNGSANADSDIDVAVVFNTFAGDYWQTLQKPHELTISVDTRIEPVLLDSQNDLSGFLGVVQREGLRVI